MSQVALWPPIGISVIALAISTWSIVEARRAANRSSRTQEQMLRLETGRERDRRLSVQKAQVLAFITTGETDKRLCVRNEGQAPARRVTILVDGQSLEDHELTFPPERPISTLGPRAEAVVILSPPHGQSRWFARDPHLGG